MLFPITWFGLEEDRFPARAYTMPINRCVITLCAANLGKNDLAQASDQR
jgi:hypothetical protein